MIIDKLNKKWHLIQPEYTKDTSTTHCSFNWAKSLHSCADSHTCYQGYQVICINISIACYTIASWSTNHKFLWLVWWLSDHGWTNKCLSCLASRACACFTVYSYNDNQVLYLHPAVSTQRSGRTRSGTSIEPCSTTNTQSTKSSTRRCRVPSGSSMRWTPWCAACRSTLAARWWLVTHNTQSCCCHFNLICAI